MNGTMIVYDFTGSTSRVGISDGSDGMLPPEERVEPADLAAPLAGALRTMQMGGADWPPSRPSGWGASPASKLGGRAE